MLLGIRSIVSGRVQSFASWVLIAILPLSWFLLANARLWGVRWVHQKLVRADYDGALARIDLLIRWFPGTPVCHLTRGTVLLFAGRLPEAEESLRTCISKGLVRPSGVMIVGLENLGCVLLRGGRFREAMKVSELVTKLAPRYLGGHASVAEVLLAQGLEPQRTLLLVDNALKLKLIKPRTRNLDRHAIANLWADRAQALAALGKMDEAAAAVAAADSEGDPGFIPGLAGTAWRCGVALLRMERGSDAKEYFRRAAEIDPQGLYGKMAAKALLAGLHTGVALIE